MKIVFDGLKLQADRKWHIFKNMNPDQNLFYTAMQEVDKYLTILKDEYNYTPAWESEFNIHSDKYWGEMKIKVKGKFEFSKN